MRQKKIFKRRHDRHPIKWTFISMGLFMLAFSSFSAGVQFGQMDLEQSSVQQTDFAYQPEERLAQHISH